MVDLDTQILRKVEHLVKLLLCVNLNWGDSNNGFLYIYLQLKQKKTKFCAVFVDIMVDLDIQILRKAEHPIKLLLCVNLPLET